MDDRDYVLAVNANSRDFQTLSVQGVATWRCVDPKVAAERVDFTVDLRSGAHKGEPVAQIESLVNGLVKSVVEAYIGARDVRAIIEAGVGALVADVESVIASTGRLAPMGIELVGIRLSDLVPSPDLVRALKAPTMEALQMKADEAGFARRAAAVEKESQIAKNELAAKIGLERDNAELIGKKLANEMEETRGKAARDEVAALGAAKQTEVGALAAARQIELVEGAKIAAEKARADILRSLPADTLMADALKEGLAKMGKVNNLTIGPDAMQMIAGAIGKASAAQKDGA
jgi:regulator of protease activity HflC (stomatin/prohibitin superfamily)